MCIRDGRKRDPDLHHLQHAELLCLVVVGAPVVHQVVEQVGDPKLIVHVARQARLLHERHNGPLRPALAYSTQGREDIDKGGWSVDM